jgi:hypothetical protein
MNPIWKAKRTMVRLNPVFPVWMYIVPQKAEKTIGEMRSYRTRWPGGPRGVSVPTGTPKRCGAIVERL